MSRLDTFRWRHKTHRSTTVVCGAQTLTLDAEGLVNEVLDLKTEERMRRNQDRWDYVAMNNDALWAGRITAAEHRVKLARENVNSIERELIRAGDMLRVVEDELKALVAERARYQAAIDGAGANDATAPTEPPKAEPAEPKGADKSSDKQSGKKN